LEAPEIPKKAGRKGKGKGGTKEFINEELRIEN